MKRLVAGLLLGAGLAMPVFADQYRVDLIVYRDETGYGTEKPLPARAPNLDNVFELSDQGGLRSAGIYLLPDTAFGMQTEWRRLANSKRHEPLMKLAWIQYNPPSENGPGLRLRSGSPTTVSSNDGSFSTEIYPIDGSVRLLMGRFLHLDSDLAYTTRLGTGYPVSFQLKERRRMRRKEIHHIDSPRLGLLARVVKVEKEEATAN